MTGSLLEVDGPAVSIDAVAHPLWHRIKNLMLYPRSRNMHPMLRDCPFARPILDLPQPERLILIGAGWTPPRPEWLGLPGLQAIFVNDKMLHHPSLSSIPPYACISRRSETADRVCAFAREHPSRPHVFIFHTGVKARTHHQSRKKIHTFSVNKGKDGIWFELFNRTVQERHGNPKMRLTTGFYITLWLLSGHSREIYLCGFDGYLQKPATGDYTFPSAPDQRMAAHIHDLNLEWQFIEQAVGIARQRGVHVEVARDPSSVSGPGA